MNRIFNSINKNIKKSIYLKQHCSNRFLIKVKVILYSEKYFTYITSLSIFVMQPKTYNKSFNIF